MILLKAFSVYDSKAQAYMAPFFVQTRGVAVRSFGDLAKDPTHEVCKHAEDYTLYEIGEFDQLSGTLSPVVPQFLIRADQIKEGDLVDALASR